ncbi:hypothetical protein Cgig2_008845 [Carnegiea gigantea]|uniref:Uncharacterized protein n=1 Tax=Carnegiea gigantea TaxID=171969 RepID=A0A9Q1GNW3_9CARY|nr:hypothetical protein Cgig2_008845 [Carnegiea gigantea]
MGKIKWTMRGDNERMRVPVERKQGQRRRSEVRDGLFIVDDVSVGMVSRVDPIFWGRVTLDTVAEFVRRLGGVYKEAIKGMLLKPILQYRSFDFWRELTLTLIGERLISFIVFDVLLMTELPTTARRVECEIKDKFNIDIGKVVRRHMAETITMEKRQVEV